MAMLEVSIFFLNLLPGPLKNVLKSFDNVRLRNNEK